MRKSELKAKYPGECETWYGIKKRCYSKTDQAWQNYGGRGIKVCQRWLDSFALFIQDMGPKPSGKHTIERINNDGDYCPENCRWATRKEQGYNKRTTRKITYQGVT